MNHRSSRRLLGLGLLLCLAALGLGCDEKDIVFVRVELDADLSGTITMCGLQIPDDSSRFSGVQGVGWYGRARLECATGKFGSVSDLGLGDLSFSGGKVSDGFSSLTVTLPRGREASWPKLLVPESEQARRHALLTLDPKGRAAKVGTSIKLEHILPDTAVSQGVTPMMPGVEVGQDKKTVTVVFPLKRVLEDGQDFVCHVTWQ